MAGVEANIANPALVIGAIPNASRAIAWIESSRTSSRWGGEFLGSIILERADEPTEVEVKSDGWMCFVVSIMVERDSDESMTSEPNRTSYGSVN
jgi:hypothetical protein